MDSVDLMFYQDDDLDFIPTYYPSTINWSEAQKLYVSGKLTNINCQVYRISNSNNPFTISGKVTYFGTGSAPIEDAVIYAKVGNEFRNFAVSGYSGNYILNMLPSGNYTLIANRMGFHSQTKNIVISNNSLINIDFELGNPISVNSISSGIPEQFRLYQNYPNPFNPVTSIVFDIPTTGNAMLEIIDITGRVVEIFADKEYKPGKHSISFDASNLSSGIYFYRLTSGNYSETKKMLLLK
jgi:hypothetical protein